MEWRDKLATFMPESECNKIVGCKSYKEHYPLVYKENLQDNVETKEKIQNINFYKNIEIKNKNICLINVYSFDIKNLR